jgi:hypothetical protein
MAEAVTFDVRFEEFLDFADELTDHFWAMHYPGGETDEATPDFENLRIKLHSIVEIIEADLPKKE